MTSVKNDKTALISGNTKRPSISARHFLITLNEVDRFEKLKTYLMKSKMLNYIIAAREIAPKTGHEHIHIYVQYNQKKKLYIGENGKTENANVQRCWGTPQQCVAYVKKEGNIILEEGILRKTGARSIRDIKAMTKDEREDLDIRFYNILEKINQKEDLEIDVEDLHKDVKVFYIHGPSGSGKTQLAKHMIKSHTDSKINIIKHVDKYWEGVGESNIALYDEFRDHHLKASEFINFIDYNKQIMNIKGGHVLNRYNLIIITSVQDPHMIYANLPEEDREQWMRRIKIIDLTEHPFKKIRKNKD